MLEKGWTNPLYSRIITISYLSEKKTDELHMWIDFHTLNANIKLDDFNLPCIADFLDKLGKVKYFNNIDLATAY